METTSLLTRGLPPLEELEKEKKKPLEVSLDKMSE